MPPAVPGDPRQSRESCAEERGDVQPVRVDRKSLHETVRRFSGASSTTALVPVEIGYGSGSDSGVIPRALK